MAHRELRKSVLPRILFAAIFLLAIEYTQGSEPRLGSSSEAEQIGRILSIRKVLQNHYFVGRYPLIHYYLLYFEVRTSDQTYCAEYETPVLEEIDDLFAAKDKDVEIVIKGKVLMLKTPGGRRIKARLVDQKQC